jgi:hypothetical protein
MSKDRLDEAIDRAVREMLDVEPPAGLPGRVLDRIEDRRTSGWSWTWIAGPAAVAAVVIVIFTVLAQWRSVRPEAVPPAQVASDQRVPAPSPPGMPSEDGRPRQSAVARGVRRPPRAERSVQATVADVAEEAGGAQVEALAGPAPLAVERLSGPPAPSIQNADVMPIQIRALEVNALPETPRERREE